MPRSRWCLWGSRPLVRTVASSDMASVLNGEDPRFTATQWVTGGLRGVVGGSGRARGAIRCVDCVHLGPSSLALLRVGPKVPRSRGSLAAGPRSPHMLQTWAFLLASFHVFMQTSLSAGSGVPIVSAMFADAPEPQRRGFPGGMTLVPRVPRRHSGLVSFVFTLGMWKTPRK